MLLSSVFCKPRWRDVHSTECVLAEDGLCSVTCSLHRCAPHTLGRAGWTPCKYLGDSRVVQDGEEDPKQHLKLHHVSRETDGWRLID